MALFRLPLVGGIGQGHPLIVDGGCPDLFPHRFVNPLGPPVLHPPSIPSGLVRPKAVRMRIQGVCVPNAVCRETRRRKELGKISERGSVDEGCAILSHGRGLAAQADADVEN